MTFFISSSNFITLLWYLIWNLNMLKLPFLKKKWGKWIQKSSWWSKASLLTKIHVSSSLNVDFSIFSFQMRYQSKVIQFWPEMKKVVSRGGYKILFQTFMQKISTLAQRAAETSKNKVTRQHPIRLKLLYLSGMWVKIFSFFNFQLTIP